MVSIFYFIMDSLSSQPKNNSIVNREVGVEKRLGRSSSPPSPEFQRFIDHTIEHGYVVVENAFTDAEVDEAIAELQRLSSTPEAGPASAGGRNTFEGLKTSRIYALINKSRVFDKFAMHPAVLALNNYFLDPGYLLNAYHSVCIQPGENPQTLHHDDGFITMPRPHKPFGSVNSTPIVH